MITYTLTPGGLARIHPRVIIVFCFTVENVYSTRTGKIFLVLVEIRHESELITNTNEDSF